MITEVTTEVQAHAQGQAALQMKVKAHLEWARIPVSAAVGWGPGISPLITLGL